MLKVYKMMKAMGEVNAELLVRKPHNETPMGYSLKLVGSLQNIKLFCTVMNFCHYFFFPPQKASAGSKTD